MKATEEGSLRTMMNGGMQSIHLPAPFALAVPSGETPAAWLSDLNERISCSTQGFEVYASKRDPGQAKALVSRFPMLEYTKHWTSAAVVLHYSTVGCCIVFVDILNGTSHSDSIRMMICESAHIHL